MSERSIIKLSQNPIGFGDTADELSIDMFESALPVQHSHSYYEDEALGLYIGVWDTTDMIEVAAPYACDEFMILIEGAVEIRNNKTGQIETIMPGEDFVIPQGYDCQWQQHGYLRKFYVILEPKELPIQPVCENVVYLNDKGKNTGSNNTNWQQTSDGHRKKVLYQNNDKTFTSGLWQSDAFSTDLISFPYNEFIHITSGNLTCIDEKGFEHHFISGDAIFIPQGTNCAWLVNNKVSISFVQIK